jgi:hypothetical protein
MINILKNGNNPSKYVMEYIADTEDDIKSLTTNVTPGSICLVIETAEVYMINGNHEWKKL